MSVYYFNGAQILAPFTITSNEPIYDVDTVSLSKQRASQGAQRWEISFNTVTTSETEADMLVGMATGIATAKTMIMPQLPSVDLVNTATNDLGVFAQSTVGDTIVSVTNDGFISKGTFVKFSNHAKIYMTVVDQTVGSGNFSVYPSLRTGVPSGTRLYTGPSAIFNYYRDIDNSRGISFNDGVLSSTGIVSLVEALI
jgi:hypothetical protein